jgi:hypothetical protein
LTGGGSCDPKVFLVKIRAINLLLLFATSYPQYSSLTEAMLAAFSRQVNTALYTSAGWAVKRI